MRIQIVELLLLVACFLLASCLEDPCSQSCMLFRMVVVESGCGVGRDITVQPFCQEVAKKLAVIAKLDIGSVETFTP